MADKVKLCGDGSAWNQMMIADGPQTHKRLEQDVEDFDQVIREHGRVNIALTGNCTKFMQNTSLRNHLMSTGTNSRTETNPYGIL